MSRPLRSIEHARLQPGSLPSQVRPAAASFQAAWYRFYLQELMEEAEGILLSQPRRPDTSPASLSSSKQASQAACQPAS